MLLLLLLLLSLFRSINVRLMAATLCLSPALHLEIKRHRDQSIQSSSEDYEPFPTVLVFCTLNLERYVAQVL